MKALLLKPVSQDKSRQLLLQMEGHNFKENKTSRKHDTSKGPNGVLATNTNKEISELPDEKSKAIASGRLQFLRGLL